MGLYELGYQVGMVMGLAVFAINSAWTPIFYDIAKNREDAKPVLRRVFTAYAVGVSTLAVGVILFSREVILIMAATAFHKAYLVVPAVAVGYLLQGFYFMSAIPLFYKKKTRVLPLISAVGAAVNIGLNVLLIPKFGMMGAAYATLISFGILSVLTHLRAQRYYRVPYEYRKLASLGILVAGVYLANAALGFHGIVAPLAIKVGLFAAFLAGTVLLKVVSVQELMRARALFGAPGEE